jgi:hypothetical protein
MSLNYEEIEEFDKKFESRVLWLERNIPPDDIYPFAQQALLAAEFFIYKYMDHVEIDDEMKKDKNVNEWVRNILGMRMAHEKNQNFQVDVGWQNP